MISTEFSKRELRYFDVAKSVAKTSTFHGHHVGCCVVYKGVVVSVASNCERTHPLQATYNKFRNFDPATAANKLHAEVHALSLLMNRKIDWSKASIYIYRELKNGKPAISKPCPACSQLISDLGIANVCYIDAEGRFVKYKTARSNQ